MKGVGFSAAGKVSFECSSLILVGIDIYTSNFGMIALFSKLLRKYQSFNLLKIQLKLAHCVALALSYIIFVVKNA